MTIYSAAVYPTFALLIINSTIALLLGIILDCIFGDPHGFPHIIVAFGKLIAKLEKRLRNSFDLRKGGVLLVIEAVLLTAVICFGIIFAAYKIHVVVGIIAEALIVWQLIATKSLRHESMKVYEKLSQQDINGARYAVSMIVGRDTESLDEDGITKAAVETVAENTSDGVIAPLFFIGVFGVLGGVIYKVINTMDSMVGYKNDRYILFGRVAAKTDDAVNFIPSRLSAVLMIFAAWIWRYDHKNAMKIFKRDRFNHASPNSAQTESVCAGALNVRLAGDAYYLGKLYKKPYIGDNNRKIEAEDIIRANRLMYAAAAAMCILILAIRIAIIFATGAMYEIF